ncbi:hypothetical protein ElyMa_000954000 [Elysia marginata]|uniref:Secreted protein n=1 Tax=Elysia marginata TaxID=1093978 RepID=A0AAV4HEK4_9GAST|nr:hypothetical protein ElyMa_000954000 [Elysia marginata]
MNGIRDRQTVIFIAEAALVVLVLEAAAAVVVVAAAAAAAAAKGGNGGRGEVTKVLKKKYNKLAKNVQNLENNVS